MSCSAQGWRTRKLLWAQVACVLECCSRRASVETLSSHESRRTSQGLATRREKPSRSLGVWIVQFDQRDRACDTCCSGLDDDRGASVAFSFIHSGRSFLIALSVITLAVKCLLLLHHTLSFCPSHKSEKYNNGFNKQQTTQHYNEDALFRQCAVHGGNRCDDGLCSQPDVCTILCNNNFDGIGIVCSSETVQ